MKIGIDIDDTIALTNEALIEEAKRFDIKYVNGKGVKDPTAYAFKDMFYWNVLDVDAFFKHIRDINFYKDVVAREDAIKGINKLYEDGYEIIFITRRSNKLKTKWTTKKWLKNNGFKFHGIVLGCKEKGEKCKELGINYFIDNEVDNVSSAIENGADSILMGTVFNKKEKKYNRVENWDEIVTYIEGR